MPEWKITKKEIRALSKQVKKDQSKTAPAEKRVKVSMTFNQAMKKIARASSPKKK
jgi:phage FluMu gp28-like protein